MKLFKTKKEEKMVMENANEHWRNHIEENEINVSFTSKNPSFKRLNNVLTKVMEVNNEKTDAIRLLAMYLESAGRDISLARLIKYLKS